MKTKFPKGFLFGAATSAHQVEGNNRNSDWWEWEEMYAGKPSGPKEVSGIACDQWHRFEDDFDLAKELGHNAHRISVEWARIEPSEGNFDSSAIYHYKEVLEGLRRRNIKTFVTLHHFTNPLWFSKKGAFLNFKSPKYFSRYAEYVAKELGDLIDFFITINEPKVYVSQGYINGTWPPQKRSLFKGALVGINLARSHNAAYEAIKNVNKDYVVGPNQNVPFFSPSNKESKRDIIIAKILTFLGEVPYHIFTKSHADFFSINHYFYDSVRFVGGRISLPGVVINLRKGNLIRIPKFYETARDEESVGKRVSDLGWSLRPRGIYHVLKKLRRYKKPIYISENGLADAKDKYRSWYIERIFYWMEKALEEGVDLRGYLHWSLIDNYEWAYGYWPRFGLVEVDRETLERTPRKSSKRYRELIEKSKA